MHATSRWKAALGAAVAAAIAASGGCAAPSTDETVVVVEGDPELVPAPGWDEYLEAARAAGGEGLYVVEGDLVFRDEASLRAHYEELRETADKLAVIQQISTGFEPVYRGAAALNIRYCVSNNYGTSKNNVVGAMDTATRSWQRVINVRFRYESGQDANCTSNNANVDFAVLPIPGISFILACAANKMLWSAAQSGCLGPGTLATVSVNAIENRPAPYENLTVAGLLRHELGHMIGFRHEHPWATNQGGCTEAQNETQADFGGRRLTPYDQFSVMHYPECAGVPGSDFPLSVQDGIGARRIYGMPAAWHVGVQGVSAWF